MKEYIPGLVEALERAGGTHTIEDVAAQIRAGTAQAWTAPGACIVTEVNDTPQCRVLHFWLATGELEAVKALSDRVCIWGREQGCTQASFAGRRGWERVLGDEWAPIMVVMRRELG